MFVILLFPHFSVFASSFLIQFGHQPGWDSRERDLHTSWLFLVTECISIGEAYPLVGGRVYPNTKLMIRFGFEHLPSNEKGMSSGTKLLYK